ncbi:enoyl-CoA hydratase/isomerase family protein [Variovorax sp. LT1R16]|uniref:enoyl-CoA hydratase/isomerase family protein n=1 Tax=Variovorax sp. LT1R16 TaxID=3443728 RepID=UPI003F47B75C
MSEGIEATAPKTVLLSISESIALVQLNRFEKKNAISVSMLRQLRDVAVQLQSDRTVKAVVLAGRGSCFSAGADVDDPERWEIPADDLAAQRMVAQLGPRVCREWEALPQPTIAAIEGFAVGGAASLALCCDFRVCAENAFFKFPEVHMGLPMGWQAVPRLVSVCGAANTKRMLLLGEGVHATTASNWGLATELAPRGEAIETAMNLARRLSSLPAHAVAMIKESVNNAAGLLNHAITAMDVDQVNWAASAIRAQVPTKTARLNK